MEVDVSISSIKLGLTVADWLLEIGVVDKSVTPARTETDATNPSINPIWHRSRNRKFEELTFSVKLPENLNVIVLMNVFELIFAVLSNGFSHFGKQLKFQFIPQTFTFFPGDNPEK